MKTIQLKGIQERHIAAIIHSGKTQKEIGLHIGVGQSTVSKYIHDNKIPALDTFDNLCAYLDESADGILGLYDSKNQ